MNTQAKVALDKQAHPERFCKTPRCLWKTAKLEHVTQTFILDATPCKRHMREHNCIRTENSNLCIYCGVEVK